MRTFKVIVKICCVLALACAVNALAMFVLEPVASENKMMWGDYREQEHIDMVYLGTSIADRAFDPNCVDEILGGSSFNMCTPAQYIEESFLALQKVVDEHHPSTVVLGLEYDMLTGSGFPDPGRAFLRYKNQGDLAGAVRDTLWCLSDARCYTTKNSINWLFPWVNEHIFLLPVDIKSNVRQKLGGDPDPGASWSDWQVFGKGFSSDDHVLDYNEGYTFVYTDTFEHEPFSELKVQTLVDMCEYCRQHDSEFVVVMPPIPAFNIFDYGTHYFDQGKEVRGIVESHGGSYYDFNLARPEFFDATRTDGYADSQHRNHAGAIAFSTAFAKLMQARAAGESTDGLFYSEDEYWHAVNYVDLLVLDCELMRGGAKLTGKAIAGPYAELEYQVCLWDEEAGEWCGLRGWSDDASYVFEPETPGSYRLRMNVREKGSDREYSRYQIVDVKV